MNLGGAIIKIREIKKISSDELATILEITPKHMADIENNVAAFDRNIIESFCTKLNVGLPILYHLSIDENDVPAAKREAFAILQPGLTALCEQVLALI